MAMGFHKEGGNNPPCEVSYGELVFIRGETKVSLLEENAEKQSSILRRYKSEFFLPYWKSIGNELGKAIRWDIKRGVIEEPCLSERCIPVTRAQVQKCYKEMGNNLLFYNKTHCCSNEMFSLMLCSGKWEIMNYKLSCIRLANQKVNKNVSVSEIWKCFWKAEVLCCLLTSGYKNLIACVVSARIRDVYDSKLHLKTQKPS